MSENLRGVAQGSVGRGADRMSQNLRGVAQGSGVERAECHRICVGWRRARARAGAAHRADRISENLRGVAQGSGVELELHTEQAFSKLRPDVLSLACLRGNPKACARTR